MKRACDWCDTELESEDQNTIPFILNGGHYVAHVCPTHDKQLLFPIAICRSCLATALVDYEAQEEGV